MDGFIGDVTPEVWVSDCWKPQWNAPAQQRHEIPDPGRLMAFFGGGRSGPFKVSAEATFRAEGW